MVLCVVSRQADMFDRGEGHLPVDHQESARLRGEVCAAAAHGDAEAERAVKSTISLY